MSADTSRSGAAADPGAVANVLLCAELVGQRSWVLMRWRRGDHGGRAPVTCAEHDGAARAVNRELRRRGLPAALPLAGHPYGRGWLEAVR